MSVSGKQKADEVVRFFKRRLKHTEGILAYRPFTLAPWEEKIIRDIYGTLKPDGNRKYRIAYIEVPKKNGKSALAAGIVLISLLLDGEPGAQVYSAASTRNQATIIFRIVAQMVRIEPILTSMCRIVDSTKTIYLRDEPTSFYRAISAEAGYEDGMNPHAVVFDELHRQKNRDLWDVFRYGSPSRSQPLLFAITTAGIIGESPICEEQHDYARRLLEGSIKDPSYYPVIYSLPDNEDWTKEGEPAKNGKSATGWYKANPALGDYLPIDHIRDEFRTALEIPTEQNSFRRFRLNQWVGQETRAIPMDQWNACGTGFNISDLAGKECIGGLDLSTIKDLTAFVLIFEIDEKYLWLPFLFLPEEDLQKRVRKDNVPYDLWAKQQFIHLTPGNEVDYKYVRKIISDCASIYNIREVCYDEWNATSIVHDLMDSGLTMVPIRQGYKSMNAPTAELLSMIRTGRLVHNNNPCLNWMADCFAVKQDPAGNIKPSKPDRKKSKKRIDGIVAGINALARIIVKKAEPKYQAFFI